MQHLGIKEPDYSSPVSPSKESKKTKTVYPSLDIKDEQHDALGSNPPKVGSKGKALIHYRIVSHEDNGKTPQYGGPKKRTRLEITHMEDQGGPELNAKDFED